MDNQPYVTIPEDSYKRFTDREADPAYTQNGFAAPFVGVNTDGRKFTVVQRMKGTVTYQQGHESELDVNRMTEVFRSRDDGTTEPDYLVIPNFWRNNADGSISGSLRCVAHAWVVPGHPPYKNIDPTFRRGTKAKPEPWGRTMGTDVLLQPPAGTVVFRREVLLTWDNPNPPHMTWADYDDNVELTDVENRWYIMQWV